MKIINKFALLSILLSSQVMAQSVLESPGQNSIEGGVGLIRGWTCESADSVQVIIDDFDPINLLTGSNRSDTSAACNNDGQNGFGSIVFWGNYGLGEHTARLLIDGSEVSSHTFTIAGASNQFLKGKARSSYLEGFPEESTKTLVEWSEANQNFVIRDVIAQDELHYINDLPRREGYLAVAAIDIEANADGERLAKVSSVYGDRLRVRACTRRSVCSSGDSIFVDQKEGSEVVIDATSVGAETTYILLELIDEDGEVLTPSEDIEFKIVYKYKTS